MKPNSLNIYSNFIKHEKVFFYPDVDAICHHIACEFSNK